MGPTAAPPMLCNHKGHLKLETDVLLGNCGHPLPKAPALRAEVNACGGLRFPLLFGYRFPRVL